MSEPRKLTPLEVDVIEAAPAIYPSYDMADLIATVRAAWTERDLYSELVSAEKAAHADAVEEYQTLIVRLTAERDVARQRGDDFREEIVRLREQRDALLKRVEFAEMECKRLQDQLEPHF